MRISSIKINESIDGLPKITMTNLKDIVVITGANGAGKTRLLKLLERVIGKKEKFENIEIVFDKNGETIQFNEDLDISIINYSHYDDDFELPIFYTPYVISQSKTKLKNCNFEETARNGLLFIEYLIKYSKTPDELESFNCLLKILLNTEIDKDNCTLFGFPISDMKLSPGQKYLLRMCIALYCNNIENKNTILFLDEPETHLHPDALIKLVNCIQHNFKNIQIWISTHSIALLSIMDPNDIWIFSDGKCKKLGSKSEPLMLALMGNSQQRLRLQQFVDWPENYACNQFAAECLIAPDSIAFKKGDKQIALVNSSLLDRIKEGGKNITIVDYGVGKGRLLEGIFLECNEILENIDYYAYDKFDNDSNTCIKRMEECGFTQDHYFNDINLLKSTLNQKGKADLVFLVNVLHEIEPKYWTDIFDNIYDLLLDNGFLVLIEHSQLNIGEKPYTSGFVVVQDAAMDMLSTSDSLVLCEHHRDNNKITRYLVPKINTKDISVETIKNMLSSIRKDAINQIIANKTSKKNAFDIGIELAFWTHQLANIDIIFENNEI